jgi:hypothetical protein
MLSNESAYNGEPRTLRLSEGNTVGSLTEVTIFHDDPVTTEAEKAEAADMSQVRQILSAATRRHPLSGQKLRRVKI